MGHHNVVQALGICESPPALILEYLPDHKELGGIPSLDNLTRSTYDPSTVFSMEETLLIARSVAAACGHIHECGIAHGDINARNVVWDRSSDPDIRSSVKLTDFGCGFHYVNIPQLERIEVRAYGCLLEELLQRTTTTSLFDLGKWKAIVQECMQEEVMARPNFVDIVMQIEALTPQSGK